MAYENEREVVEGIQYQGTGETVTYSVDLAEVGTVASLTGVTVLDESDDFEDVSATVMPSGSNSLAGNVVTCKPLTALTLDRTYRVQIAFTVTGEGAPFVHYFRVRAQR